MFDEKSAKAGVTYARGFKAAGVRAGIKKSGDRDLAVIYTEKEAVVAGTFTTNKVAAAPVYVSKEVVAGGKAHAIVANSGCANACTGEQGMQDAHEEQEIAAAALGCEPGEVLVGSTGMIGECLPMIKVDKGIKLAISELSEDGSANAGSAIITTDTYSKACSTNVMIGGKEIHLGAICKGAGMIRPNMATMLCFITTDVAIEQPLLQHMLSEIVETTFNMISVDGDMSTNDMVVVLANGAAGNQTITEQDADYEALHAKLLELCTGMAKRVAGDGEGATKLLTINVHGTESFADAKTVGMSVANSPLVKTAFFGGDPNWGRVICAVGYAPVPMYPEKTVVKFGGITVYDHGVPAEADMEALRKVMEQREVTVDIYMGYGNAEATVWTCDFSYEYVKINGEYST